MWEQREGGRGERKVWQRLKEQHPELEGLTERVTFLTRDGQRERTSTPVVDLEGWLQILALLPGATAYGVSANGQLLPLIASHKERARSYDPALSPVC